MSHHQPLIGVVMGSDSDWPTMQAAAVILKEFGVPFEARVVSAHRTPDLLFDYAAMAGERGLKAPSHQHCRPEDTRRSGAAVAGNQLRCVNPKRGSTIRMSGAYEFY